MNERTGVDSSLEARASELFEARSRESSAKVDRLFVFIMLGTWVLAVLCALVISPYTWEGKIRSTHTHVYAAIFLGGAISSLPIYLGLRRPGDFMTRLVICIGQVLWSALLIHLTGGRIETHFHVFGSLGLIAFYRDVRVLVAATVVVAADHFLRGIFWPESVYGIAQPEWWRFLEHAGWVVFIDVFLSLNILRSRNELREMCVAQLLAKEIAERVGRIEKLAAVGQLAASVGHELRNPLATIRNAHRYLRKRISGSEPVVPDAKMFEFFEIIEREMNASSRIISDLLDFSRPKEPIRAPCPIPALVDEVIGVVPSRGNVRLVNAVPQTLPVPDVDKDQLRQVLVNLVQNASEAIPATRTGEVTVRATASERGGIAIEVVDDGEGIPESVAAKVFEPLFSTKTKGTGLGLAIVRDVIERHGGRIDLRTSPGVGSTFTLTIPVSPGVSI